MQGVGEDIFMMIGTPEPFGRQEYEKTHPVSQHRPEFESAREENGSQFQKQQAWAKLCRPEWIPLPCSAG